MGFPRQEHWSGLPYPSTWRDLLISPIVSERHVGYFQSFITSRARIPYPRIPSTRGNGSVGWLPGQGRVQKRSSRHREPVTAGQPASCLRRSQAPQPPHPSPVPGSGFWPQGPPRGPRSGRQPWRVMWGLRSLTLSPGLDPLRPLDELGDSMGRA